MFAISSPISPISITTTTRTRAPRFRLKATPITAAFSAPPSTMYELLSIPHTAGPEEIRAAYRRQALRWHPDACRSSADQGRYAERFMQAHEAYEVLSDSTRRRNYDLSLSGDRWAAAVGAAPAFREGRTRRREGGVTAFGNWDAQLEGLFRRSAVTEAGGEDTWGGRVRRSRQAA
ncbi:chaperone protein dnaJ 20, chloroplastic-like [Zingiber officinale]|uniref:J domain-containing protein n=1 Tax=Zingiber officinale TaxID=94328 RepID=A0A8J5HTX1_ZINOF|nr:chaperone protein dnaJ 20, chloroplastic-like [Zingiber officinale]KAG6535342.1 hypothetical protein ZIOFF_000307 [Zingiber officinale]